VAPLRPAESAIQLDTTKMTIEEVMQVVWQEVVKIFPELA
jgi:cytidylate kinase